MFSRKAMSQVSQLFGHVASVRPMPVDIDLSEVPAEAAPVPAAPDRGWLESSRDLQRGLRVRETPMHALPPELIDAFLGPRS